MNRFKWLVSGEFIFGVIMFVCLVVAIHAIRTSKVAEVIQYQLRKLGPQTPVADHGNLVNIESATAYIRTETQLETLGFVELATPTMSRTTSAGLIFYPSDSETSVQYHLLGNRILTIHGDSSINLANGEIISTTEIQAMSEIEVSLLIIKEILPMVESVSRCIDSNLETLQHLESLVSVEVGKITAFEEQRKGIGHGGD